MTRAAAEAGIEQFVDRTIDATREAFRVERALRGTGLGPAGRAVDLLRRNAEGLERRVIEPELRTYRQRALDQFAVVLEYAESDDPIDAYTDDLLAHDSYVETLRDDVDEATRSAVIESILDRNRRLGDGIAPLLERPEDEFWPAVTAAFDREEAIELVEDGFPFTGPLREHRQAFAMTARIDPGDVVGGPIGAGLPTVEIEYTDEALRSMRRAERTVVHEIKGELRDALERG